MGTTHLTDTTADAVDHKAWAEVRRLKDGGFWVESKSEPLKEGDHWAADVEFSEPAPEPLQPGTSVVEERSPEQLTDEEEAALAAEPEEPRTPGEPTGA